MRGRLKLGGLELSYWYWFKIFGLWFWVTLHCSSIFAQINDDFYDGNISDKPIWLGDSSKFKVINGKLISTCTLPNDKFYISTPSVFNTNFECRFYINLQFNTSSLNYVDVFVCSDSSRLIGLNSGYFIRVGSTDDDICLYKKNGSSVIQLINGRNGLLSKTNNALVVKLILNETGHFDLWEDSTGVGQTFELIGSCQNQGNYHGNYAGFLVKQSTSSFFKKHVFDDFYIGPILVDTVPPRLLSMNFDTEQNVVLIFNEKLGGNALSVGHFDIDGQIGSPLFVKYLNADSTGLLLGLREPLQAFKVYQLSINGISDMYSNILDTQFTVVWYPVFTPKPGEIVVNEFLPDPDHEIGLPPYEFVELLNTSDNALQLKGCSFSDNTATTHFPDLVLLPDSLVLICAKGTEVYFAGLGRTIGLTGFPSLNNTGEQLTLANAQGQILHKLSYDLNTYQDESKTQGGWSLELQDALQLCISGNFIASVNMSGGTPGRFNSVARKLIDTSGPVIQFWKLLDAHTLKIVFNELPDSLSSLDVKNFGSFASNLQSIRVINETILLHFKMNLDTGLEYHIPISGIKDCLGNTMTPFIIKLLIPFKAKPGDIIINEILFNPTSGGYDFVELFNRSDKPICLSDLRLFNVKTQVGTREFILIDTNGRFLDRSQYLVLTENPNWVCNYYPKHQRSSMLTVPNMPSFPDDEGVVGIMTQDSIVLDLVSYNEYMHFELLIDKEGVSLERISQEFNLGKPGTFTSAAASVGNATPGLPNSKLMDIPVSDNWLTMSPEMITPNEDGNNDLAAFVVNSSNLNEQVTIKIFDVEGYLVKDLANNIPIGNSQTFYWDGLDSVGKKVSSGLYLVYASRFGFEGKQRVVKKVLAVGSGN